MSDRSEPRPGEPYVIGGVVQGRPCGCTVDGRGTLPDPLRVEPCGAHAGPAAQVETLRQAAEPFAELGEELEDRICHFGICPVEECGRCGRVLALRRALEAELVEAPPDAVVDLAEARRLEELAQVEAAIAELDDSQKTAVLILSASAMLPIWDVGGAYQELGLVNERGTLTELGRACAKRILEDDPEAR